MGKTTGARKWNLNSTGRNWLPSTIRRSKLKALTSNCWANGIYQERISAGDPVSNSLSNPLSHHLEGGWAHLALQEDCEGLESQPSWISRTQSSWRIFDNKSNNILNLKDRYPFSHSEQISVSLWRLDSITSSALSTWNSFLERSSPVFPFGTNLPLPVKTGLNSIIRTVYLDFIPQNTRVLGIHPFILANWWFSHPYLVLAGSGIFKGQFVWDFEESSPFCTHDPLWILFTIVLLFT